MSCWLLSEEHDDYYRTYIYFTIYNDLVVIARECKTTNVDFDLKDHTVMPRKFIPILSQINTEKSNDSKCGGYIVREESPDVERVDCNKLPFYLKRLFYNEDCNALPFSENQLGYFELLEEVSDIWKLPYTAQSSDKNNGLPEDEATTMMETPTIRKRMSDDTHPSRAVSPVLFSSQETPANTETPGTRLCLAPKKLKTEECY